jgi:hypothetical protein
VLTATAALRFLLCAALLLNSGDGSDELAGNSSNGTADSADAVSGSSSLHGTNSSRAGSGNSTEFTAVEDPAAQIKGPASSGSGSNSEGIDVNGNIATFTNGTSIAEALTGLMEKSVEGINDTGELPASTTRYVCVCFSLSGCTVLAASLLVIVCIRVVHIAAVRTAVKHCKAGF